MKSPLTKEAKEALIAELIRKYPQLRSVSRPVTDEVEEEVAFNFSEFQFSEEVLRLTLPLMMSTDTPVMRAARCDDPARVKSRLNDKIRSTVAYRNWKSAVFERDRYTCQECQEGGDLDAHHIRPLAQLIDDHSIFTIKAALDCPYIWDVSNGRSLCRDCHQKVHQ